MFCPDRAKRVGLIVVGIIVAWDRCGLFSSTLAGLLSFGAERVLRCPWGLTTEVSVR